MATGEIGRNLTFPIFNSDGTAFNDLVLHKATYDSVVMSLGDKITGDVYYRGTDLAVTMGEYIEYDGVRFVLVSPPTIVREGMVSDNSELKGLTKYSFTFYHPMYMLNNFPFSDIAVTTAQSKYLSQNKSFSWIGNLTDFVAKINKNLEGTQWYCDISSAISANDRNKLSEVIAFDKNTIADALKKGYETWEFPYIISKINHGEPQYSSGKRFLIRFGLPTTEITVDGSPFVFEYGQGVGLKNNSRTPRNNKIVTRLAGYGSEDNIPYGYPQIRWYGDQSWDYTVENNPSAANSYPIYDGILGGQKVRLIKHPFTRTHLMPSVYVNSLFNKVSPYISGGVQNPNYNPNTELKDYYDADNTYPNPIVQDAPSYEIHEFGDIKPELQSRQVSAIGTYDNNYMESVTMSDFLDILDDFITQSQYDVEKTEIKKIKDGIETHDSDSGSVLPPVSSVDARLYSCKWSYHKDDDFAYVKYESNGQNFEYTVRLSNSMPSPDWDDTMDDDGNYVQSYFTMTLPALGFDLYACAAITQQMSINMRSGACIGCTFPVAVDWEDYKRNFYDENGDFDPVIGTGHPRNGDKYPNSTSSAITVVVQKETSTFGTLMPNIYQKPAAGDDFVILGISLPSTYVTSAEERLDDDMEQYMRDNNVYYFDYPFKFDEAFLATHTDILQQMKPNVVVRFKYNGETLALYIKQMSIKFGDKPLPEYNITLTDDVEIVLNQIGSVTEEVSNLRLLLGEEGGGVLDGNKYLRKDKDDTASGLIRLLRGIQVGERFVTGLLGEGGIFRKDADGTTYLECDKMYVRMKAYFDTVEVRKYLHSGGNRIASAAGIKCSRVEWLTSNNTVTDDINSAVKFRCYFRGNNDGVEITNDFVVGDQAFCHETNVNTSALDMRHYWRLVIAKSSVTNENGEHWIDLSNYRNQNGTPSNMTWVNERGVTVNHLSHQAGSDIPLAQDDIIQLGNADDTTRQGAIIEYVTGEDAPSYKIYQNIDDFSFEDTNFIALGYNSQTGHAYLNVYGDAYIGDPDGSTFIKYEQEDSQTHQPKMTIKAVVEFVDPDTGQSTQLEDFANTVVTDIENIQSQIDGELDTWYYAGVPTLQNAPANQWTTDDDKKMHVGDLYYDKDSGFVYRFIYDTSVTPNVYKWIQIHDDAISEALKQAEKAQDTADHKRRVFVVQPTPIPPNTYVEYDVGDLWTNATGTFTYTEGGVTQSVTYDNDLLRCKRSKPIRNASGIVVDGAFSIADWELATGYTDDTKIDNFLDGYQGTLTTIRNQVDQKAETYYQDNDPSTNQWGAEHVGDMWFCTSNHTAPSKYQKGTTWVWQEIQGSYVWAEAEIPQVVFDTIDGKKAIYVAWNTWYINDKFGNTVSNLALRDLLIPASDITPQGDGSDKNYYANRMYRCVSLNPISFQEVDYVDNQTWSNAVQQIYGNMSTIEGQVDKKAETWYQNTNPENAWTSDEKSHHVGDLWLVNIDVTGSQIYKAGTTWYYKDNGVGTSPRYTWERQVVPQEVFDYADGKAAIFVGSTLPTNYHVNDMWFIGDGVADANLPIGCIAGDVVVSSAESTTYNKSHWAKKDRYTDDSKFNGYITQIINGTSGTSDSAQVAQALHVIKAALNENTSIDGGLILTSLISLRSNNQVWAGISGLYDATKLGSGIASWYGGLMKDYEALTDAQKNQGWSVHHWARSLFRFDGSGYLATGNVSWDEDGVVTIKNLTTLYDSNNEDVLNKVASLTGAFHFSTRGSGSSTVTYINPQMMFDHIRLSHESNYGFNGLDVLNRNEMDARYVRLDFFNALFQAYSSETISDQNKIDPTSWTAQTTVNNLKILVGAWTDQYLSAKGLNNSGSGGSGVSLNEPLNGINTANIGAPSTSGQAIVWNGSAWVYSIYTTLRAAGLYSAGTIASYGNFTSTQGDFIASAGHGFKVTGSDNTSVLLAGGGTKPLSEIGSAYTLPAATAAALGGLKVNQSYGQAVTVQSSGNVSTSNYGLQIDSNGMGFVYVPCLPLNGGTLTGDLNTNSNIKITGYNNRVFGLIQTKSDDNSGHVGDNIDVGWNWTNVDGSGAFFRSSDADGSFGFYARKGSSTTQLVGTPAGSLKWGGNEIATQTWVNSQGFITSATDTKNTTGGDNLGSKLFLVGMTAQTTNNGNSRTYTNSNCYTSGGYLYSGGLKVATESWVSDQHYITGYTDTKNTAGTTNLASIKLFIVGAASQAANPQTYSNSNCYVGSDNCLYSNGAKVATGTIPTKTSQLTNDSGYITSDSDTKNTAGATNLASTKLFIIGATAQNNNPVTYSNTNCYVDTDNCLYSNGSKVATGTIPTKTSQLTNDSGYLTSGDVVTTNTAQSIGAAKTFTATLTSSAGGSFTGGLRFYSICIECNSDGTPNSGRSGEINRYGSQNLHLQYDSDTGGVTMCRQKFVFSSTSSTSQLSSNNNNFSFLVGTGTPYIDKAWQVTSDMRKKDIARYINLDISRIADAPVFDFTWKNDITKQLTLGSSAQYWQSVFPNAIRQTPDGYLGMDYSSIALASAVLTARKVVDHEKRIRLLEVENEALRREIDQLKKAA